MKRAARTLADALEHGLSGMATRSPRIALALGDGVGRLRNRLSGRWPSPDEVQALFPALARHEAARIASRIGGVEARSRIVVECLGAPGASLSQSLVPRAPAEIARLQAPLILGFFHVGAFQALGAVLECLPGPVLAFRHRLLTESRAPLTILSTEGNDQERAAVFLRAFSHLGAGGFVATALDEVPGQGLRVPLLGRSVELARGPFALSRLSGAPLVPLVARWHGSTVTAEVGAPLTAARSSDPGTRDLEQATAAARWIEGYLRRSPGEIGLGLLRRLVQAPAGPSAVSGPAASS